jgi:uncharacterized RDD family membrane protein YckC/Tfp pilus assembly protein PilE
MTARLQPLPTHYQDRGLHAGFWRRVVAWVIDGLILSPICVAAYLGVAGSAAVPAGLEADGLPVFRVLPSWWLIWLLIPWLYFSLCESSRWQATPGKLALGLRVTDEYGGRIGFGRATGRFFGKLVSGLILDIGYLLAGWTERKQALHDLMAGCCVVRRDGLLARQNRDPMAPDSATPFAMRSGMPGWAVALVVIAVCVLLLPFAAIVAAIAIPTYQSYVVRAEVAQGVDATLRARALIAEYIGQRGALPDNNGALGLPQPEAINARYVSSVRVVGGKVVVTFGNQADMRIRGGHVVIAPIGNAAALHWQCSSPDIRDRYLPESCR